MDIKTKDDLVKKLRAQVEEAARKAARETYSKLKSNELDNEDTGKDDLKENKIKEEVLASGAAFAIAEHIKTLGIDGETTDEQEEEIGEIGRGVALIEYQRIKNDEDETKTLQKEAAERYAKLLQQVEEAARQAAAELFASSSAGEESEVELPTIEEVGLEAAKAHYEKHE